MHGGDPLAAPGVDQTNKREKLQRADEKPRRWELTLFARLVQASLCGLFCLLALVRHAGYRPARFLMAASVIAASVRNRVGSSSATQLNTKSPTIILIGNATVSSCSCELMRPNSASETSTNTRIATTGRASRRPVENMVAPSDRRCSPAPREIRIEPGGITSRLWAKMRRTSRSSPRVKNSSPDANCAKITRMPESAWVLGSMVEAYA